MAILKNLGKYKNFGLLLIRIGLGILFIYHGLPKLLGGRAKWDELGSAAGAVGIHFMPMFWGFLCAIVETFGGVLVIVGLWFRPVCLLLVFNLLVAALAVYGTSGRFSDATHALEDMIVFAGLFIIGPGSYSVDKS